MAGRKRKYLTKKAKKEAQNRWAMEYYERNKDIVRKKNLKRYYKKKEKLNANLQNNKSN
jgi:hypothetical protein